VKGRNVALGAGVANPAAFLLQLSRLQVANRSVGTQGRLAGGLFLGARFDPHSRSKRRLLNESFNTVLECGGGPNVGQLRGSGSQGLTGTSRHPRRSDLLFKCARERRDSRALSAQGLSHQYCEPCVPKDPRGMTEEELRPSFDFPGMATIRTPGAIENRAHAALRKWSRGE
jgi:hypothetical protein